MTSLKKKLIQIVEWDIERCSLTYGNSPCAAVLGTSGVRKCYNTFRTCQDTDNFATSTETLRFAMNVDGLPRNERIYPCMSAPVGTNPAKINLGGVSDRSGPLGKRARVTIRLKDFKDSDIWFDRYQSERVDGTGQADEGGYNPKDRGTFFAKLRRRFPYYVGRKLRVLEGEVGQPLSSMRKREYVVSEWRGPDANGAVEIIAKDVLDLADNKKALCPAPSTGKLSEDIAETGTPTFDLTPSGVGSEYSASGRASIGSEVVSFSRSGDTVTITGRALDGTEASSHDTDDLFQQAYRVEDVAIADVANDLLVNFANIDAGFVPLSDWQAEAGTWLGGFNLTTTITKPTGVLTLLGELAQLGVFWWWDDVDQEIKMRANRPPDYNETVLKATDSKTFIEKSMSVKDLDKERLTRVLLWHGQLDASKSATDGNNYRRVSVSVAPGEESSEQYNQVQVLEVFSRWLGVGQDSIANAVSGRLLNRYRGTPREISFSFDVKDASNIIPGSPLEVTTRLIQDETGNSLPFEMQVTSVEEAIPGHRLKATAQTYQYSGNYGFITENSRPDYGASTDDQKRLGTYIVDDTEVFADGRTAYIIF